MPTVSCLPHQRGDLELAADAVGAGDEHRVPVPAGTAGVVVEVEQAGEPADALAALARRERRRDDAARSWVRARCGWMPAMVSSYFSRSSPAFL